MTGHTGYDAVLQVMRRALADRRGVTILEYGLILAVASLIILAVAELLGSASIDNFNAIEKAVSEAGDRI